MKRLRREKFSNECRKALLQWKPHEKSRSLGEIASHIANLPGLFIAPIGRDGFDRSEYEAVSALDVTNILKSFDENIAGAVHALKGLSDEKLMGLWRYTFGGKIIFEAPRLVVFRATALNQSFIIAGSSQYIHAFWI